MTADEPVTFTACGVPDDAPPEVWRALAEVARAAVRAEDARRAALSAPERAAEDARAAEAAARLVRVRRRLRGGR